MSSARVHLKAPPVYVMLLLLVQPIASAGDCSITESHTGQNITMRFTLSTDISTNTNFIVSKFQPELPPDVVLECTWLSDLTCTLHGEQYYFNHKVSDTVTIGIHKATKESEGSYQLQPIGRLVEVKDCSVGIGDGSPLPTTAADTSPTSSHHSNSTERKPSDDTKGPNVAAIVAPIVGVIIATFAVLFFVVRHMRRKRRHNQSGMELVPSSDDHGGGEPSPDPHARPCRRQTDIQPSTRNVEAVASKQTPSFSPRKPPKVSTQNDTRKKWNSNAGQDTEQRGVLGAAEGTVKRMVHIFNTSQPPTSKVNQQGSSAMTGSPSTHPSRRCESEEPEANQPKSGSENAVGAGEGEHSLKEYSDDNSTSSQAPQRGMTRGQDGEPSADNNSNDGEETHQASGVVEEETSLLCRDSNTDERRHESTDVSEAEGDAGAGESEQDRDTNMSEDTHGDGSDSCMTSLVPRRANSESSDGHDKHTECEESDMDV